MSPIQIQTLGQDQDLAALPASLGHHRHGLSQILFLAAALDAHLPHGQLNATFHRHGRLLGCVIHSFRRAHAALYIKAMTDGTMLECCVRPDFLARGQATSTRTNDMNRYLVSTLVLCVLATCRAGNAAPPDGAADRFAPAGNAKRPNVVYILADDLGYGDIRRLNPEHGKIATPHVDRLASEGMVFTDAHSGSSVCTPSRYGILTGRYAWRTRLQSGVLWPYNAPLIAPGRLTVPALLQQHGYHTACIGKWHLGWNWPRKGGQIVFDRPIADGPTARGFHDYFGVDVPNFPPYCFIDKDRMAGNPTGRKTTQNLDGLPGPMLPGWQFDAILPKLTAKAVDCIGQRAADKRPFFLYFALTSPHEPIAPSARFRGKSGISPLADFIMETDWVVGQVLEALDKHGLAKNTLVIFTSDNGHAPYTGLKALLDAGHWPSQRLRGYKSDIWEGGHRIPFIVRWPGTTKAGATCHQLICLSDLMATCAEVLGTSLPENAGEDSASILSALRGAAVGPLHEAVVHHSWDGRFSLRQGKWKLELCSGSGGWSAPADAQAVKRGLPAVQLYDMAHDDRERVNLQHEHPEIVERLTKLLERYVADGRSTPGPRQKNDVAVDIWKNGAKARSR
jgi:arylsulfatase A